MRSNYFSPSKKIKATKEVFGTTVGENKVKTKTSLERVSKPLPKKKTRTAFTSNIFSVKKKAIIPIDILRKKSQKTNISLGNLHANNYSWKRGF